ncbi:MAG TPA: hypothetical protein VJH03_03700 [Blastocatellia bacterium]|nr:hypothetical protein [Blastocatellia bacterium]
MFNVAVPVDEDADLPVDLVRQLRELPCEFLGDDLPGRDAPREQFFEAVKLTALEPLRLPFDITNNSSSDSRAPCLLADIGILHQIGGGKQPQASRFEVSGRRPA